MSNEEVERAIQFLLDNQAQHDYRLAQLETAVVELAQNQRDIHGDLRNIIERMGRVIEIAERTMAAVRQVAEANAEMRQTVRHLEERVELLEARRET